MITFCIALLLLVAGYFVYGAWVEKVFGVEPSRTTPAYASTDGIDYIPMPTWKVFLIQFLNIAGTGPIFGAILGILYGPSAYLWIVFGCIFGGAVHDYLSGMISLRKNGASLPEVVGDELGRSIRLVMRVFSLVLLADIFGTSLAVKRKQADECAAYARTRNHGIDEAVLHLELGALEAVGELLANGLLDHSGARETD